MSNPPLPEFADQPELPGTWAGRRQFARRADMHRLTLCPAVAGACCMGGACLDYRNGGGGTAWCHFTNTPGCLGVVKTPTGAHANGK